MRGKAQQGTVCLLALLLSACQQGRPPESPASGTATDSRVLSERWHLPETDTTALTPQALYEKMNQAVRADDLDRAVFYYSLAGSRSFFDAEQIKTQYARSMHHKLLRQALSELSEQKKNIFWQRLLGDMQQPAIKKLLCQRVQESGAPVYAATYMQLQSAIASVPDTQQWQKAVGNYLDCQ